MNASKTPEEILAANRFASFVRGWRAGAIRNAMCPKHLAHKTLADMYRSGYETGMRDSTRAEDAAAERYHHHQTVLRAETMAALRGRSFGDIETPTWDNSSLAEVFEGDGVGDPRKHEGFATTTELAGSIESVSVTITAAHIEGLWNEASAERLDTETIVRGFDRMGPLGRFMLHSQPDGCVWATCPAEPDLHVMVVKPDPEAGQ